MGEGGGDPLMTERAGVQPVGAPQAGVGDDGVVRGLGDGDAAAARRLADAAVEGRDARAQRTGQGGCAGRVGSGKVRVATRVPSAVSAANIASR